MEKRGLSAVVAAMMMIALAIAMVAIVWTVVNNLVSDKIGSVEGCTDLMGKVEINKLYTCYDSANDVLQFSISVKDVELDGLRVSIASQGSGSSFLLNKTGVEELGSGTLVSYTGGVPKVPGKNSGLTYNYTLSTSPDSLHIAPIVGENQCGETDSVLEFPSCDSLV